jgi:hypothetical protein
MVNANNPNSVAVRQPDAQVANQQAASQKQGPQISDGSVVDGLVTGKSGEGYMVRIGSQTIYASSTVPLFIGQRFRAVWDASTAPPTLRLRQADMAVLAKFTGRDQQIAFALLSRGLPVNHEVIWGLRQQWMQNGADPAKLGAMIELWARGSAMNESNVALLSWYMGLLPEQVSAIWKKIRDRMHGRKFSSPRELLDAIRGNDDDIDKFLDAHALAGKPARRGIDPAALLAQAWWPAGGDGAGSVMMANVSISSEELDGRRVWWLAFGVEGKSLGQVLGDVMTNGRALSVNLKLKNASKLDLVRSELSELREELSEVPLVLQYLGVGISRDSGFDAAARHGLDMEA